MNAPTLNERLRYIDIFMQSPSEAKAELVAEGVIDDRPAVLDDVVTDEDRLRGRTIGERAAVLIAEKVFAEGINPAVIGSESPRILNAYEAIAAIQRNPVRGVAA